ncbi:hypothetical protein D3C75_636280 [compost metagenome]
MPADPLAACPGQQWPEQAANTPQLRHMGVGPHQRIIPVALTNQHQRQGEQAPRTGPEQHPQRPDRRCMQQQRNRQAGYQQGHRTAGKQSAPRHMVGQRTDGQLQHRIAHHHGTDHEQGDFSGKALLQAIHRQQGKDHRLERGEQGDGPGNHRQAPAEGEQVAEGNAAGLCAGCPATAQENQRRHQQQAGSGPEAEVVIRAEKAQHQRPGQLAEGIAAAIQRHQAATPLLDHQLVDPAFAEDEHHGQRHTDQQSQQQPQRVAGQQCDQADRQRPAPQAQAHGRGHADPAGQAAGHAGTYQHAQRRHRGHHADGEAAVAPGLQAQGYQRHAYAECQPDA